MALELLGKRLAKVISKVVSDNQSASVGDKQILDTILVLNESVYFLKREGTSSMVKKVDFEKAYDSVLWDYIDEMMEGVNFCWKWRKLIKACLSLATMSALVNGSPSEEFALQRGLRQGDPLSPFLFLIAAEGFNCVLHKAIFLNLFEGVAIGNDEVLVSHLQFADDTVIIGKASSSNVMLIKGVLRLLEISSGLRVNYSKSSLHGIHADNDMISGIVKITGCKIGCFPFVI